MKEKITEFIKGVVLALLYIGIFVGVQALLAVAATYTAMHLGFDPFDSLINFTGPVSLFTALVSMCIIWCIYYLRGIKVKSVIEFKSLRFLDWACCFVMAIGMRVLTSAYMLWAEDIRFLKEAIDSAQESMNFDATTPLGSVVMVAAICIVAPVFEEILFRGFIQSELKKAGGVVFAIIVQGLLFAAAHLNPAQVIFTLVIGIILGIIYHKTRSIGMTILIHMVFNISVVMEIKNTSFLPWIIAGGALMVVAPLALIFVVHRNNKEEII